ncbi:MAG TPA: hypothetical protein PK413_01590 [Thermoanaerobaculia bacterium]|nr:hypothetical protein [Thermoanaerobaculia bacterium]
MDSSQGPILSESSRRPPNYSRLAWGLVLVILGCLLLVGRFQLMEVDNWLRWTPLVVVGIGLFSLAQAGSPGQVRSGLWMIGIGVWLLVSLFHFYGLSFNNSWPFWPLYAGLVTLLAPGRKETRWDAVWPIAIGLWLFANVFGWLGLRWSTSWPVLVILSGILLVMRGLGLRPHRSGRSGSGREEVSS